MERMLDKTRWEDSNIQQFKYLKLAGRTPWD